jgi:glycosyltransferase involved in cell wall biosynthesis
MHLLIDGQALQTSSSRQRGIGRYSSNLLRALAVARPRWRIEVVQNTALAPIAVDDLNGLPVLLFHPPLPTHSEQRELNERYYADWLTARGADGVMILSHCEGWEAIVPSFCGLRPRVFGIAYDLIPLLYPEHYLTDFGTAHWYAHRFRHLLQSDALLAISEATARDVRTLGAGGAPLVVNIAGAVDPLFAPLSPSEFTSRSREIRERFGLQREFVLYVGALDYRKNLRGALRAFGALPVECRASLDLAVVCRMQPAEQASVMETARQAGVTASLRLICSAGDEELRALYQMCRLFFFPSLYEGLGLPVLEALHCGAPVVTANNSSLPEYAGPHSWLGDPSSPQSMADVLREALAEPRDARRHERELFARGFTWQRTAERACAVMERSKMRRSNSIRRRRRVAWAMPLTRSAAGAIAYAEELLPHLAERFDIEVIAASGYIEAPQTLLRHHLILTAREVTARHAAFPYDAFVYQLVPPPGHLDMLDLLWQFPGLVVVHNFTESDLRWLTESKLLPHHASEDSRFGEKPAAGEYTPVLGVLVHATEAWQQVRRALNASTVHLPSQITEPAMQSTAIEQTAAAYAAWIDLAIDRLEQSDGLWRGFAMQCLAECGREAGAVIDSWASLRSAGQRDYASRQPRDLSGSSHPAAA